MRLIRLPHNVGRAAARQVALDAAAGDFLAKLDADDWIYPQKLARQLDILERMPDVALVSTGIAIENEHGQLAGVRARGDGAPRPPLHGLASPPVAHAPSLIRMHIARAYGYDVRLRRSEDADYLLSLLTQHGYCVMNDVLYAYREYRSTSRSDTLDAYRARMKMLWKRRRQYPFAAPRRVAETALKWGIYQAAFATGRAGALIARRSAAPSQDDIRRFRQAVEQVAAVHASYFRDTGAHDGRVRDESAQSLAQPAPPLEIAQ